MVKSVITARIDDELLARLRQATDRNKDPYAPTMTQMIERGAALALAEYERREKRAAKKGKGEQ